MSVGAMGDMAKAYTSRAASAGGSASWQLTGVGRGGAFGEELNERKPGLGGKDGQKP